MDVTVVRALHHSSTSIRGEVLPDTLRFSEVAWVLRPGSAVDDAQNTMLMAITQEDAVPAVLQEVCPVLWQPLCRQPFWPKLITLLKFLDDFNLALVFQIDVHQCANVRRQVKVLWLHQYCQELAIWAQTGTSKVGWQPLSPTEMPHPRPRENSAHAWVDTEKSVLEHYDNMAIGNEQALGAF